MSLTLEIHRLRERVRHLETQLAANQSAVTQTNDQLQQLFHQVQHIDAQLRHCPPDGSANERPSRGTKKSLTFSFCTLAYYRLFFFRPGKKKEKKNFILKRLLIFSFSSSSSSLGCDDVQFMLERTPAARVSVESSPRSNSKWKLPTASRPRELFFFFQLFFFLFFGRGGGI